MDKSKIARINELSKKSKTIGLTSEEKDEQQLLRTEYINAFRNNLKTTLESIVVVDRDGKRSELGQKGKKH